MSCHDKGRILTPHQSSVMPDFLTLNTLVMDRIGVSYERIAWT